MKFYVGLHQPSDAKHFDRCFISINRLKTRKSNFEVNDWILDSGAFTQVAKHGEYTMSIQAYAHYIRRWSRCGNLVAACAQDYMCEPFMFSGQDYSVVDADEAQLSPAAKRLRWEIDYLVSEGANPMWFDDYVSPLEEWWDPVDVREHQELTVDRYDRLRYELRKWRCPTPLLPVLQGYEEAEYVACLDLYEEAGFLPPGAYAGVGSICKRNSNADTVRGVLGAILERRPDLQLHGFGLKRTALEDPQVVRMLSSSDSMAWSFAARYEGRNGNDWREAKAYEEKIKQLTRA